MYWPPFIESVDAGDEPGLVGGEDQYRAGDLLGLAKASHRNAGDNLLQHIRRDGAHHVGLDRREASFDTTSR
jgi:hypothetical protein